MQRIQRLDGLLARVESWVLVVSLLGILALGVLQIVMRLVAHGFPWADEVMRNLTLWVGFIGASLATWEGKHLNVDALTRFLGPRAREVMAIFVDLAAAGVTAFLAYSAGRVFLRMVERLQAGDAAAVLPSGIPVAVWQSLIPVAFGIIALRFLLKVAEAVWVLRTGGAVQEIGSNGGRP